MTVAEYPIQNLPITGRHRAVTCCAGPTAIRDPRARAIAGLLMLYSMPCAIHLYIAIHGVGRKEAVAAGGKLKHFALLLDKGNLSPASAPESAASSPALLRL